MGWGGFKAISHAVQSVGHALPAPVRNVVKGAENMALAAPRAAVDIAQGKNVGATLVGRGGQFALGGIAGSAEVLSPVLKTVSPTLSPFTFGLTDRALNVAQTAQAASSSANPLSTRQTLSATRDAAILGGAAFGAAALPGAIGLSGFQTYGAAQILTRTLTSGKFDALGAASLAGYDVPPEVIDAAKVGADIIRGPATVDGIPGGGGVVMGGDMPIDGSALPVTITPILIGGAILAALLLAEGI